MELVLVMAAPGRLGQGDYCELEASLGYIVKVPSKKKRCGKKPVKQ